VIERVKILISHYNRIDTIKEVVIALRNNLGQDFEINIADDKSDPKVISKLYKLKCNIIENAGEKGLGGNMNNGLNTINSKYLLSLQDDHVIKRNIDKIFFNNIVKIMDKYEDIDIIRFLIPRPGAFKIKEIRNYNGLTIVIIDNTIINNYPESFNVFSFWPHLIRMKLFRKLGVFETEGIATELEFGMRCLLNKAKIAYVIGYENIFYHLDHGISNRKSSSYNPKIRNYFRFYKTLLIYYFYKTFNKFPFFLYRKAESL
jgi:hypothetical protein